MAATDGSIVGTTTVVDHGPAAFRFNIVVMSDGYRSNELAQFATDVQGFVDQLRITAPFCYLWEGINVYRVDVSSTDSGADDPTTCADSSTGSGATPRTYFDATFCSGGVRRLLGVDSALALQVAAAQVPSYDFAMVIVNTPISGGKGGAVASFSRGGNLAETAMHEMGHTAFRLADEYEYWAGCGSGETDRNNHPTGEPTEPNVTTKLNSLKWGRYVLGGTNVPTTTNANCAACDTQGNPAAAGTVGAYEGAHYYHCSAWRPEFDCRMRTLGVEFCRVCQDVIMRGIYFYQPFRLRIAWKGVGSDWNIYLGQGLDSDQSKLNAFGTGNSPALASFNGLSMAWRGAANDQRIWYSNLNSPDGVTWSPQQVVPNALTSTAPALAPFNGRLYMAWKGAGNDQSMWFNSLSGGSWSNAAPIPQAGTSSQPALCAYNNRLVAVWKGISNDQRLYYTTFDGSTWQSQKEIPNAFTSHYATLTVFQGRLYLAFKGAGFDPNMYYATFNGSSWSVPQIIPNAGTSNAPALAAWNNSLFLTWVGIPGDPSLYYTVFDGTAWRGQHNYFGVGSSAAPAMIVH